MSWQRSIPPGVMAVIPLANVHESHLGNEEPADAGKRKSLSTRGRDRSSGRDRCLCFGSLARSRVSRARNRDWPAPRLRSMLGMSRSAFNSFVSILVRGRDASMTTTPHRFPPSIPRNWTPTNGVAPRDSGVREKSCSSPNTPGASAGGRPVHPNTVLRKPHGNRAKAMCWRSCPPSVDGTG